MSDSNNEKFQYIASQEQLDISKDMEVAFDMLRELDEEHVDANDFIDEIVARHRFSQTVAKYRRYIDIAQKDHPSPEGEYFEQNGRFLRHGFMLGIEAAYRTLQDTGFDISLSGSMDEMFIEAGYNHTTWQEYMDAVYDFGYNYYEYGLATTANDFIEEPAPVESPYAGLLIRIGEAGEMNNDQHSNLTVGFGLAMRALDIARSKNSR